MYVVTNGNFYHSKTETNGVKKVKSLSEAYQFETKEEAENQIKRAPSKLKNYTVKEITDVNLQNQKVCKRKSFSQTTRKEVYRKSKGNCCLCGKFVDYDDFTVDHIIPLAKGGTNDIDNLQCACKVCNNIKTDVLPNEFMDKITEMIIHNMNNKYNKRIGHKIIKMLFTANIHRIIKQKAR